MGGRAASWVGSYVAPGVGGHLKVRPWRTFGLELFSDNFLRPQEGALRHDHVIGFSGYFPSLFGSDRFFVAPTAGACVDFRFAHPSAEDAPSVSDVLFGVHGGLMAELFLPHGFSLELDATITTYLGHDSGVDRWSAVLSNDLKVSAIGLALFSVNLYL